MIFDSKNQEEILRKVYNLRKAHQDGLLGGEKMPEDENPHLNKSSKENYMYFTLPMALNYQRNSNVQELLASRWAELLKNTDLVSIDVHTPMWLWSRGKFEVEI